MPVPLSERGLSELIGRFDLERYPEHRLDSWASFPEGDLISMDHHLSARRINWMRGFLRNEKGFHVVLFAVPYSDDHINIKNFQDPKSDPYHTAMLRFIAESNSNNGENSRGDFDRSKLLTMTLWSKEANVGTVSYVLVNEVERWEEVRIIARESAREVDQDPAVTRLPYGQLRLSLEMNSMAESGYPGFILRSNTFEIVNRTSDTKHIKWLKAMRSNVFHQSIRLGSLLEAHVQLELSEDMVYKGEQLDYCHFPQVASMKMLPNLRTPQSLRVVYPYEG